MNRSGRRKAVKLVMAANPKITGRISEVVQLIGDDRCVEILEKVEQSDANLSRFRKEQEKKKQ